MNRAIKYRIYPTIEQCVFFANTFGCCRKVWNLMLADKKSSYETTGSFGKQTPAMYKNDYPFLKEVDSLALANVQLNLQKALKMHFEHPKEFGFPVFKSRKNTKQHYTTNNQHGTIELYDGFIKLPKVGYVKAKIHRYPKTDWLLKSATISLEPDGKYYASVLFDIDTDIPKPVSNPDPCIIGLDYKSDGLYADSENNYADMPHFYQDAQKRLAKEQRRLSHKVEGSHNYLKQQKKVAKIHSHIANQRKDFLHKKSTEIANQYDVVCVETLNMKAMANKGFGNGKATLNNGYGMFQNMLEYKLFERGKPFIRIDMWFPSSQMCHCCGDLHPEMKNLALRRMQCSCGWNVDRDYNAALNIRDEGVHLLTI